MEDLPEGVIRFHERLEGRIVLASLQSKSRKEVLGRIDACKLKDGRLANFAETCVSAGYCDLMIVRDLLYETYPRLKEKSTTFEEHQVYFI